ncbi:MAG: class I SAM-dependent methyltransferase [Acidimicrobiales bacterium]
MSEDDGRHWDERYGSLNSAAADASRPPSAFAEFEDQFPRSGSALVLACGWGAGSVWLARRGVDVWGVDISAVAIGMAEDLAAKNGVQQRCRFDVFDLDAGLPDGPTVDLILCNMFQGKGLEKAMVERLAPGGLLAMAVLSEVDSKPGRFSVAAGELQQTFDRFEDLDLVTEGEENGRAWILARKTK